MGISGWVSVVIHGMVLVNTTVAETDDTPDLLSGCGVRLVLFLVLRRGSARAEQSGAEGEDGAYHRYGI